MLESEFRNIAIHRVEMARDLSTDNENTVNGFDGEFAFSDHNLVPQSLRDFLMESFPKRDAFRKIPLEDINGLLNAVWQGPGSMAKIKMYTVQLEETTRLGSPVAPVTEDTTVEEFVAARENHVDTV
jgi:hypothetical protein